MTAPIQALHNPRDLAKRTSHRVVSGHCSIADARAVLRDLEREGEYEAASWLRSSIDWRLSLMRGRGFRSWVQRAMALMVAA